MATERICDHLVFVQGQPYCTKLDRQLPSVPGDDPLTPNDCEMKPDTDGYCIIKDKPDFSEVDVKPV